LTTVALALVGSEGDALASGTCTYDADRRLVTATMDDEMGSIVTRSGQEIVFVTTSDNHVHDCEAATVTNTKRIDVTGTGWTSDVSNTTVVSINESAGRLAPGAGRETTRVREIEVRISVTHGVNTLPPPTPLPLILSYVGTAVADRETVGTSGLDLNGDGDLDVTTTVHPFDEVWLFGLSGNDRLGGGGGTATGTAVQVPMRLLGGAGDDRLRGGTANDELDESAAVGGSGHDALMGGAGEDSLNGGGQNDRLAGGTGEDQLFGGRGSDAFFARDGYADSLTGGAGFDEARVDAGVDGVTGIERIF
jgi:Ca2+-binding RTX toxin-like protein